MTPEEFAVRLDKVKLMIADGTAYIAAWQALAGTGTEYAQALGRFRPFFSLIGGALLRAAAVEFSKVLDKHPRTVSMPNLILAAKANLSDLLPYGSAGDLQEIEDHLALNARVISGLRTVRHKRLAHYDKRLTRTRTLSIGEIVDLGDELQRAYNSIRKCHDRQTFDFGPIEDGAAKHAAEVVQTLRSGLKKGRLAHPWTIEH